MDKIFGQRDLLLYFSHVLSLNNIPYLLTGSFAVSYYGYPRATHDIDFIIEIADEKSNTIVRVIRSLKKNFTFASNVDQESITTPTLFNLYHGVTGIKIDFWVVDKKEFFEKYSRRQIMTIDNQDISLVSPEDLILNKLKWCKEVFSEKHLSDCIGIWKIQNKKLDLKYLTQKVKEYDVSTLYEKIKISPYE